MDRFVDGIDVVVVVAVGGGGGGCCDCGIGVLTMLDGRGDAGWMLRIMGKVCWVMPCCLSSSLPRSSGSMSLTLSMGLLLLLYSLTFGLLFPGLLPGLFPGLLISVIMYVAWNKI